ncbi:MAG: hypothetical protein NDI84_08685 [Steroidobacteraceae bacterium]|nr:hypothetical protein [Steroidobacteraceae bacterium]
MALLRQHAGIWEGEYTHLSAADWSVVGTQRFRIIVEVFDSGPVSYRQSSHYWYPDGREEALAYEGVVRASDDRVVFDNGRIRGECWAIAPDTLYLWFGFAAMPESHVTEMIQLTAGGGHRARTWHWFRDGALEKVTLVRERRVAGRTLAGG